MGLRPSDVSDYFIYCFNEVVATFGAIVDAELNKVEGKSSEEIRRKQEAILQKYIGSTDPAKARGQFADPALMFK